MQSTKEHNKINRGCIFVSRLSKSDFRKNFPHSHWRQTSLCWRWSRFRKALTKACGSTYLHQSNPTSRGCSIWKRRSLTLPVSAGTRSALWSTSACSRSTWLDADERIRGKNEKQTTTEWTREDEFNELRIAFLTSYCAYMSLHTLSVSRQRPDYWQNNNYNKH